MLTSRRAQQSVVALVVAVTLLAGCGDDAATPEPTQTIQVSAGEYFFTSDVVPVITAGETVRFVVTNDGRLIHEMQVLDATGRVLGRTAELAPGESETLDVTFDEATPHQVICDVDDHLTQGQRAVFLVEPA